MLSFPVPVLSFLFVSFRPSSLRFPQLFHECFPFAFAFGLFRFLSGSFRPLLFRFQLLSFLILPFLLFPVPPHSGFFSAPLLLSLLRFSPFFPAWFPVHSFPVPVLGVPVCFLLPYPDSLPQLFLRCLLPAFAFRIFRFPSDSFRPLPFRFRLLSATVLPFLFSPASPHSGFSGAPLPLSLLRLSPFFPA